MSYSDNEEKQRGIALEEEYLATHAEKLKRVCPEIKLVELYYKERVGSYIDGRIAYQYADGRVRFGKFDFKTTKHGVRDFPRQLTQCPIMGTYLISQECHHILDNDPDSFLVLLSLKDNELYVIDYSRVKVIDLNDTSTDTVLVRIGLPNACFLSSKRV